MDNTLVASTSIGDIKYDEYLLNDSSKDLMGNVRMLLDICIIERTANITNILTAYSKSVTEFDRVRIRTYFEPSKNRIINSEGIEEYATVEPYVLDLDTLDGIDDVLSLIIAGPSSTDRLVVNVHLDDWDDAPGVDGDLRDRSLDSATWVRFENCSFRSEIVSTDRSKLLIEFSNCEFNNDFRITETREPSPISNVNVFVENCVFSYVNSFICDRLNMVVVRGTTFDNKAKTPEYFDALTANGETVTPSDYISPVYRITKSKKVLIEDVKITNILTALDLDGNTDLTVNGFSCSHVYLQKSIRSTIFVHNGVSAKLSNLVCNGVLIDTMESIQIVTYRALNTDMKNSEYGIQINRVTKEISLSDIVTTPKSVNVGVSINACSAAKINIIDSTFDGINTGITVNGISGDVIITDCTFVDNTAYGCKLMSVSGRAIVMDSTFARNIIALFCQHGSKIDIINVTVTGNDTGEDYPKYDVRDVSAESIEEFRIIGSNVRNSSVLVDTSTALDITDSYFDNSFVTLENISAGKLKKSAFNLNGLADGEHVAFELTTSASLDVFVCEFMKTSPKLTFVDTVTIKSSVFEYGCLLYGCGDTKSDISDNTFGSKLYDKGLQMYSSKGIDIHDNTFSYPEKMIAVLMSDCMYNHFSHTNVFTTGAQVIDASDNSILNMNHIVIDTSVDQSIRPKVKSQSLFMYALYLLNQKKYFEQYTQVPEITKLNDLVALSINIVSFINPSDDWVATYLARLNAHIRTTCALL